MRVRVVTGEPLSAASATINVKRRRQADLCLYGYLFIGIYRALTMEAVTMWGVGWRTYGKARADLSLRVIRSAELDCRNVQADSMTKFIELIFEQNLLKVLAYGNLWPT